MAIQLLSRDSSKSPQTSPDLAISRLTILSLAKARMGEVEQSKQSISTAETLCNCGSDTPPTPIRGQLLFAKGSLALQENDFVGAQNFFRQSLEIARINGNQFLEAEMLTDLGVVDLQRDHYENSLVQSQGASDIAKKIGARQILVIAQGNEGWAYYETGDYTRALASFNDAADSAATLGSPLDEEHWLDTAGMSEARLGNVNAARDRYNRALALARNLENTSEIAQVDQALASLLLRTPYPEQAEKYIDEARTLAQQENSAFDIQLGNLLEAQLLAQRGELPDSKRILLNVEQQTQQFPTTQLDAQHTLAQVCEKSRDNKQAEIWYQRSIATYHEQRSQLQTDDARLPFFETGRDLYMDYAAFLIRNHRADDALNLIDQGRAETLAEGLGVQNKTDSLRRVSLRRLARHSHAVILVYALSSPSSYLWASNGKDSGFYLLPDRSVVLAAAAAHQRALLAARDLVAEQHPAARTLYDMLLKPAAQLFHPGDRVYIVGAGGLSGLNFETLLTPGPSSHYWIEDVTVTHFSSLRFLAMPPRSKPRSELDPARVLIIGNPIYAGSHYSPLPNAAQEVSGVAAHFPAASRTLLTGARASPGAYLQSDPARFAYIHFVSHATASRLVPLDSAVILSGNGEQDSAKLYARDILNKPLDAELVTISACQGSGIRTYAGEGLVGLAWAFLRAGSHNVIGALWDVSDASTPELMEHLYDGIAAGQPPDVSLRAAKLELLHSRGVFRKPLYWGAFQLYSSGR